MLLLEKLRPVPGACRGSHSELWFYCGSPLGSPPDLSIGVVAMC